MVVQAPDPVSYADYLELEARGDAKHEFLRGVIFAMAGGTPKHASLQAHVISELVTALRGKPCETFSSDLRIRVEETDFACYADVTVVCGKLEASPVDKDAVVNPKLLIEVLSDSTEAHDRGTKAAHYRRIPSLEEYAFVSQHEPLIEVYRKNQRGRWELAVEARAGEIAELASVGAVVSVDGVYADPLATT